MESPSRRVFGASTRRDIAGRRPPVGVSSQLISGGWSPAFCERFCGILDSRRGAVGGVYERFDWNLLLF